MPPPPETDGSDSQEPSSSKQEWLCPICGGTGYLRQDVPVEHPNFIFGGRIGPVDEFNVVDETWVLDLP